jgi:hypothetical protein
MEANTNLKDQYKTIEILKDKITSVMETIPTNHIFVIFPSVFNGTLLYKTII